MAKKANFFNDKSIVGSPVKHYVILCVVMFAFWFLLSGKTEVKFLFFGVVTALVSSYICMPLLLLENRAGTKKYFAFDVNLLKYIWYWVWLLNEVRKANLDVAQAVVRSEMDYNPTVFTFTMKYDNPMAHATLANSITLTPGTITMDVSEKDGVYTIHALTNGAREGLLGGDMQRRIAKLFGETYEYVEEEGEN